MLKVTDAAVDVFRDVMQTEESGGSAIRIAESTTANGGTGIMFQAVEGPMPGDSRTEARDLDVFVSQELAPLLDDAVLDAREAAGGTELFLRSQGQGRPGG